MPGSDRLWPHDEQCGFRILPNHPQTDPKEPIAIVQFWPVAVALKHGELLTQSRILQSNLFLTAEDEKNKTNPNRDTVQHRDTSLRPPAAVWVSPAWTSRIRGLPCDSATGRDASREALLVPRHSRTRLGR